MSKLDEIFASTREVVEAARSAVPLNSIKERARDASPPRGFRRALDVAAQPVALIAEVKMASPSRGLIRPDFDPGAIAREYAAAGAHALSVLTNEQYFQGSLRNLELARAAVDLPCLRKEFICDPYQVYEARAWGADAILLILAAPLSIDELVDLEGVARHLGMDVLFEVHNEDEADSALALKANLIGVNNRDLADFKTSLEVSRRLIPWILEERSDPVYSRQGRNGSSGSNGSNGSNEGPPQAAVGEVLQVHSYQTTRSTHSSPLVISESAIETLADVECVRQAGARAVLIGTTFCASPDVGAKVKEVMGW